MFEQIILDNSELPIAKLWNKSTKAYDNPLSGIEKISNKSVKYVIRDCALIARHYLPLFVYSNYDDPIEQLKGKFTKTDIVDFVNSSFGVESMKNLLIIILNDIPQPKIKQTKNNKKETELINDDIYGDYMDLSSDLTEIEEQSTSEIITINSKKDQIIDCLCEAFKVKGK